MEALLNLKSVLCDPEGRVCISGSNEDIHIIQSSLTAIEKTIEHQAAQIEMMREFIARAPVSSGVCCCGESMNGHSDPMNCGHTPVDLWDYSVEQILSTTPDQALERFAAKVREQCAQVCFDRAKRPNDGYWTDAGWATVCSANELAGEAILEIKEIPK